MLDAIDFIIIIKIIWEILVIHIWRKLKGLRLLDLFLIFAHLLIYSLI